MRILIFRRGLLGDTIAGIAALRCIRSSYPTAEITFVAEQSNPCESSWPARLLEHRGLVDEIIPFQGYNNPSRAGRLSAAIGLFLRLIQYRWDFCIHLDQYERTQSEFALSRFLRIDRTVRASPTSENRSSEPEEESVVDELIRVLEPLALKLPAKGHGDITLPRTARERAYTKAWISQHPYLANAPHPWVAVAPWSNMSAKEWPTARFCEVILALRAALGRVTPIIIGGPDDIERSAELIKVMGLGASIAGELQMPHLIELLSKCDLYLGIDTGPMHLAAAAQLPSVVIFSARDRPKRWDPYGVPKIVLRRNVPCSGCMLRECLAHAKRCILEIQVEEVKEACLSLLSSTQHA